MDHKLSSRVRPSQHAPSRARAYVSAVLSPLLLLFGLARPIAAQEGLVAGRVESEQSLQPIRGAQVMVEGTGLSAITDMDGAFVIRSVPGSEVTLRVTVIGYKPVTRTVSVGSRDIVVRMEESAIQLDEIIVTGTPGATQKRAIGNAVGAVDAAELTEIAPISNTLQALNARVPGVTVLPGQGNVGTGGVIRIRGVSTLSLTNEPIVYVDGVRINSDPRAGPAIRGGSQVSRLDDINPDDIARIEIIKGPAAATLYGTEASNGVVQIITKKGAAGDTRIEATVRQGANWFADAADRIATNYAIDPDTGELLSQNLFLEEQAAGRDIFETGHVQTYGLKVSGGTDRLHYFLSGQYDDEEGIVDYNWSRRYNTRGNVSTTINEQLNLNANFGFVRNHTRLGQAASGWDLMAQIIWGSPLRRSGPTRGFLRATPEAVATIESFAEIDRFTWGITANHEPLEWFTQRLSIGADIGNETNSVLFPRHPQGDAFFFGGQSLGEKTVDRLRSTYTTVDYAGTASLNLTDALSSATSLGMQYYSKILESTLAQGRVFPAPGVESVGGAAVTFGSEDLIENKTLGVYVQERLSWRDRVFITGAVRADDNSAFGENFDLVYYPKVSGSWVVHEEPFFRDRVPFLSTLRLRGAWGRAGQQPDVFAAIRLYQPATGPAGVSTLTPLNLGNPDLEPEKGEELELGFEAGLLDDRVGLNFTYWDRTTRDAIVERGVAPSSGFSGIQFVNVGEVTAHGFEVGLDAQLIDRESLNWGVTASYSTNDSEVLDLGGLPPITFGGGLQAHREGFPIGAFFFKNIVNAEFGPGGELVNVLCEAASGGAVPCDEAPPVYMGRADPTWTSTISSTLSIFRNLRLYGLIDVKGGHHLLNGDIGAAHVLLRNSRAINEGTDPKLAALASMNMWRESGYMDAGYAKLRELSATYILPTRWVQGWGVSQMSVNVAGRNLATLWQAQEDIFGRVITDPEVRDNSELSGYVQTVMPQYTQFLTTVRVTF